MTGIELIAAERERQVTEEGWTPEHDDQHDKGEIARAAAAYAMPDAYRDVKTRQNNRFLSLLWPWSSAWWKPTPGDRVRELTKAGALICAEIDRLQRAGVK